jgi:hypothetical protein
MSTEWITDRQPTKADEDKDGEVVMQRFPDGRASSTDKKIDAIVSSAHVGAGVPWMHTDMWEPPAEPAPVAPAVSCDLPGYFGETITSVLPTTKYASPISECVISTAAAKRLQHSATTVYDYYDKILPGEPWLPDPGLDPRPMRDNDSPQALPDLTLGECCQRWGVSSRNAIKARATALGVELRRESSTRTVWPSEHLALGDELAEHLRKPGATLANFGRSLTPPVPVPTATKNLEHSSVLRGATLFYVIVASDGEYLLAWETDVYAGGTLKECLKQQKNLLRKYQNVMIAECKIIPELTKP